MFAAWPIHVFSSCTRASPGKDLLKESLELLPTICFMVAASATGR